MDPSTVQAAKQAAVEALGVSRDALHVYVGLSVFILTALILRQPLRAWWPWLAAVAVAVTGEGIDAFDDIRAMGRWRWIESVHDVVNTIFWPTIVMLVARYRKGLGA